MDDLFYEIKQTCAPGFNSKRYTYLFLLFPD